MTQTIVSKFFNETVQAYQEIEDKTGLKSLQNSIPSKYTHLTSIISGLAMGYFAYSNTDKALLGAGFTAGLILAVAPIPYFTSLKEGPLLPMSKNGSFALQKTFAVALVLGKHYGFPSGFFMGHAICHLIKENFPNS